MLPALAHQRERPWLRAAPRVTRAAIYLALRVLLPGTASVVVIATALSDGPAGVAASVGLGGIAVIVLIVAAPLQRRLVRHLGRAAVPDPHGDRDGGGRARLRSRASAREAAYAVIALLLAPIDLAVLMAWTVGSAILLAGPVLVSNGPFVVGPLTIGDPSAAWAGAAAGFALLVLGAAVVMATAEGHARLVGALLGPRGDELRAQVTELTQARLRLIDAFDVERRRIERDLHDGAQQQLTSLAMSLDLARIELDGDDPDAARALIDRAHTQATRTIIELRDLIHGIHPPVLTDLGLPAATAALADRNPVPVSIVMDVPGRLDPSIESTAYFVFAEALANIAKHSAARHVELRAAVNDGTLTLSVSDDGRGGADARGGSGLTGLGDRVAAVSGTITLSSPPGGPTNLTAKLPLP